MWDGRDKMGMGGGRGGRGGDADIESWRALGADLAF